MTLSTVDALKGARAEVGTPKKWKQFCAAQACMNVWEAAGHRRWDVSPAQQALADAIGLEDAQDALYDWNDAQARTHAEVMAAFDKAIAEQS